MPLAERDEHDQMVEELRGLQGGVIDTSTLIYGEHLHLLPLLTQQLRLVLIPQVVAEFGSHPHEMDLVPSTAQGTTDETLLHTAIELHLPLLSEDGRLLRRAQALHHPHYNTLMLLLALLAQGQIAPAEYDRLHSDLLRVARYAPAVVAQGQALHQAFISSMDGQKV